MEEFRSQKSQGRSQTIRGWGLTLLFFIGYSLIIFAVVILVSSCDSIRMAPSEAQKKIAFQGAATARAVENAGTDAGSPAATHLVDATAVALSYTGIPKNPSIQNYATTLAAAGQDAARRPTADEIWSAGDSWIDFGIALLGIFGGTAGIAATQFLVKARQKSRALREVVGANEKLKQWLRERGKDAELNAFYDMQNAYQDGRTEAIVAAERARVKPMRAPPMPPVKPPKPSMN